jgi:hypothetical protein
VSVLKSLQGSITSMCIVRGVRRVLLVERMALVRSLVRRAVRAITALEGLNQTCAQKGLREYFARLAGLERQLDAAIGGQGNNVNRPR